MATTRRRLVIRSALCCVPIALLLTSSIHAMETKVFAIGDFGTTCGGNDISHWPDMVDEWYDEMGSQGETKDGQYTNGSMTLERFCDPDWNSDCDDDVYVDDADAAMLAFHGSDDGDHWSGTMRSSWNGFCTVEAGGSAVGMSVGDVDLEFIHLSSCHSAEDDNLSGIRNGMTDPVDGGFAHQWDGFHGLMWIGSDWDNDYEDFGDDGHSESMASAWVDNLYGRFDCAWYDPWNWGGTCTEQCPVAYAISSTESDSLTRLSHERYNNVYSDPTGDGWYAFRYIEGCDPDGETAFNP